MAAPPSQRFRQISFYLSGGGIPVRFDFVVRPEDLTRTEPSRLNPQQTLGGAWVDAYGLGLPLISLSGTTGWRGGAQLSGEALFKNLRDTVMVGWHDRRTAAAKTGFDPNTIKLGLLLVFFLFLAL